MDEAADDVYENTDFANTGLSAVALYDYQVKKPSFLIGISGLIIPYTLGFHYLYSYRYQDHIV